MADANLKLAERLKQIQMQNQQATESHDLSDLNHNDDNETGISTNFDYAKNEALSMKQQMEELIQSLKNGK